MKTKSQDRSILITKKEVFIFDIIHLIILKQYDNQKYLAIFIKFAYLQEYQFEWFLAWRNDLIFISSHYFTIPSVIYYNTSLLEFYRFNMQVKWCSRRLGLGMALLSFRSLFETISKLKLRNAMPNCDSYCNDKQGRQR
jgi:hypothetical protein